MRIVLCTANAHRHRYVSNKLKTHFNNLLSINELNEPNVNYSGHLLERDRVEQSVLQFEECKKNKDIQITKGEVNSVEIIEKLSNFKPDFVISYGCSILSKKFIEQIPGKKINVHLGLSPYYRGAGTNFWPVFNMDLHLTGITYHELTDEIDGGKIYAQRRSEKVLFESIHHLGNNLIKNIPTDLRNILENFSKIKPIRQSDCFFDPMPRYVFRKKDFSEKHAKEVNKNFDSLCKKYVNSKEKSQKIVKLPK